MLLFITKYRSVRTHFFNGLFALSLLLGGIEKANSQYRAIHIPNEKLLSMDIDGDLKDWDWVPGEYMITCPMLANKDVANKDGVPEPDDYDIEMIIGWNSLKNWLYFAIEIKDDYFAEDPENPVSGDYFKIYLDPANNRKDYREGTFVTKCDIYTPLTRENSLKFHGGAAWMNNPLNCQFGREIKRNTARTTITYEIGMNIWDEWNATGPSDSRLHCLKEGVISVFIEFYDIDENGRIKNTCSLVVPYTGYYWWENSNAFSFLTLDASPPSPGFRLVFPVP